MKRSEMIWLAAMGCSLFGGCSAQVQNDSSAAADAPPEQVVAIFLEAVRIGDEAEANALLTPLARKKTAESQMVVAPPGSQTASYKIGTVELEGKRAGVECFWTDLDGQREEHTDRIVWHLRKESVGWRIAGMSAKVFPDQDPVQLNFEDPQEMLRKQQSAEAEVERRERGERERLEEAAGRAKSIR